MTPSRKPAFVLLGNGKSFACLPSRSISTRARPYVGRSTETGKLTVFHSDVNPTEETHGDRFKYAIGPFRTARAARVMAECGEGNPHLVTVEECEHFARVRLQEQVAS